MEIKSKDNYATMYAPEWSIKSNHNRWIINLTNQINLANQEQSHNKYMILQCYIFHAYLPVIGLYLQNKGIIFKARLVCRA